MYKNILVPVLLDESHDTQASYLAAKALADEGAVFTVIHVVEAVPSFVESQIPRDVLDETHETIKQTLHRSASALPEASVVMVTGHAAQSILQYAEETGADCIVIASHRPGMEDFFLGSTASRVVRHAKCSVHVIR